MPDHKFTTTPSRTGYQYGCRCDECRAAQRTFAKAYREKHPDKVKAYTAKYRNANREKVLERGRIYNQTHKEERRRWHEEHPESGIEARRRFANRHKNWVKEYQRLWREANREKTRQYAAKYKKTKPDQYHAAQVRFIRSEKGKRIRNAHHIAYVARKAKAQGETSLEQLEARCAFYGNRCYLCGAPANTIDHVIPLSRGGSHWPSNLRPACKSCNSRKSDTTLADYLHQTRHRKQ